MIMMTLINELNTWVLRGELMAVEYMIVSLPNLSDEKSRQLFRQSEPKAKGTRSCCLTIRVLGGSGKGQHTGYFLRK